MYMNVQKLSLAVTDGLLLRELLDRKYGTSLRMFYALTPLPKVLLWFIRNLSSHQFHLSHLPVVINNLALSFSLKSFIFKSQLIFIP